MCIPASPTVTYGQVALDPARGRGQSKTLLQQETCYILGGEVSECAHRIMGRAHTDKRVRAIDVRGVCCFIAQCL